MEKTLENNIDIKYINNRINDEICFDLHIPERYKKSRLRYLAPGTDSHTCR